jgi:Mor family transcriptional regulator
MSDAGAKRAQFTARVRKHLLAKGVSAEQAVVLAEEVVQGLWAEFAGDRLYFPFGRQVDPAQLCAAFTGANQAELAKRFGLSRRRVEQILAAQLARHPKVQP